MLTSQRFPRSIPRNVRCERGWDARVAASDFRLKWTHLPELSFTGLDCQHAWALEHICPRSTLAIAQPRLRLFLLSWSLNLRSTRLLMLQKLRHSSKHIRITRRHPGILCTRISHRISRRTRWPSLPLRPQQRRPKRQSSSAFLICCTHSAKSALLKKTKGATFESASRIF